MVGESSLVLAVPDGTWPCPLEVAGMPGLVRTTSTNLSGTEKPCPGDATGGGTMGRPACEGTGPCLPGTGSKQPPPI